MGVIRIVHPVVGTPEFDHHTPTVPARPDRSLLSYLPRPGSPTAEALGMLLSWVADRPDVVGKDVRPAAEEPTGRRTRRRSATGREGAGRTGSSAGLRAMSCEGSERVTRPVSGGDPPPVAAALRPNGRMPVGGNRHGRSRRRDTTTPRG
ncbi:hypothetical protein [Streptomyces sp. NPDC101776]|uniref:MmyB family transcriptional regulator n=1 Tax=Streptomyces sp. NPDC101776 TaxID=3366146 RepID=UPI0037F5E519